MPDLMPVPAVDGKDECTGESDDEQLTEDLDIPFERNGSLVL